MCLTYGIRKGGSVRETTKSFALVPPLPFSYYKYRNYFKKSAACFHFVAAGVVC